MFALLHFLSIALAGAATYTAYHPKHSLIQYAASPGVVTLWETLRSRPLEHPDFNAVEVALPWANGGTPLVSCSSHNALMRKNIMRPHKSHQVVLSDRGRVAESVPSVSDEESNLREAVTTFCKAGLGQFVEFYIHPDFQSNYDSLVDSSGWIPDAFVTYMSAETPNSRIAAEEDMLVRSVRHFSEKPVILVVYGNRIPEALKAADFPRMVLMQAKSTSTIGKSFNFNKLTAMLFTKVRNGLVLDADQWVNTGVDALFPRIAQESSKDYPYPIMPVHWMSRDPESSDMRPGGYPEGYSWRFVSKDAPPRTMHWGHAHPSWSHHALPWLATWTSYILSPESTNPPDWLRAQGNIEDEDLLNVGLWASNVTKQWCKYDITSPDDFRMYIEQNESPQPNIGPISVDSKWYPKGIALMFFTAHDAKKPDNSFKWLQQLWVDTKKVPGAKASDGTVLLSEAAHNQHKGSILYDGKWFVSGSELQAFDSSLRCLA
jgi:hypothetical protein